jgi:metal-responsive CopG/Arc/MetJ family transcriptional regulator
VVAIATGNVKPTMSVTTLTLPAELLKRMDHKMVDADIKVRWRFIEKAIDALDELEKQKEAKKDG